MRKREFWNICERFCNDVHVLWENVSVSGAPSVGFLEQSVTSSDNPYLRSNVHAIKSHQMEKKKSGKPFSKLFPFESISIEYMYVLRWQNQR